MKIKVPITFSKLAVLSIFFYATSCVTPCPDCVDPAFLNEPDKIISVKQAKSMYDAYDIVEEAIKAVKVNADGSTYNPTRYVEYTFEEMKHYMAYIENEAKLAKVDIATLRIYFGAYPKDGTFTSGEQARYQNQESIFIVPTATYNGKEVGFYTSGDASSNERYPVYFSEKNENELYSIDGKDTGDTTSGSLKSEASMLSFYSNTLQDGDDRSLILNDGNVIPPPEQDTDMDGKAKGGDDDNGKD